MPRVFKKLDRTICKYIKFVGDKLNPMDEIFRDNFTFKDWEFFLTFNKNRGIQPFFYVVIVHPASADQSHVDLPAYAIEFRWYGSSHHMDFDDEMSISLRYMDSSTAIKIFHKSERGVEYNELRWLVKIMKRQLHLSLNDFDLLSSKFNELMVKMI